MTEFSIGFDTSNYTTSCAVFDGETGENKGRLLDVPEGALGMRQSEALFSHIRRMPEIFAGLPLSDGRVIAVGASAAPRETEGSYMPCFLAGASHGAVLARGLGAPFFEFSHQQGHVAAAAWSAGRLGILDEPMLCWHLSGGTTELLFVEPAGGSVTCKILGGTSDVSAGQLIDRAGNLLCMKFPSGAELDRLASGTESGGQYAPKIDGYRFSLSGVEHKMKAMVSAGKPPGEIAYFTFWAVTSAVRAVTAAARKEYGGVPVLYTGGVASSGFMRRAVPDGLFAEPKYSADNAMGIAILAYRGLHYAKTAGQAPARAGVSIPAAPSRETGDNADG